MNQEHITPLSQHAALKGTLRRKLSHGYYSLTAKYISNWLTSYLSHPQLLQLREQSPIFYHDAGKFDPCSGSFVQRTPSNPLLPARDYLPDHHVRLTRAVARIEPRTNGTQCIACHALLHMASKWSSHRTTRAGLTQCGLGQDLPPYQVASWSIQPFGHNRHGPKIGGLCPI